MSHAGGNSASLYGATGGETAGGKCQSAGKRSHARQSHSGSEGHVNCGVYTHGQVQPSRAAGERGMSPYDNKGSFGEVEDFQRGQLCSRQPG